MTTARTGPRAPAPPTGGPAPRPTPAGGPAPHPAPVRGRARRPVLLSGGPAPCLTPAGNPAPHPAFAPHPLRPAPPAARRTGDGTTTTPEEPHP